MTLKVNEPRRTCTGLVSASTLRRTVWRSYLVRLGWEEIFFDSVKLLKSGQKARFQLLIIAPVLESTFFSIYHQFIFISWFYFYQRECKDRHCKARLWNPSMSRPYWSPTKGLGMFGNSCLGYNFSICLTSGISQCVRDLSGKCIVRSELCVSSQLWNSDWSHLVSELVGLMQQILRAQHC